MNSFAWFYQLRDPRDLLGALRHLFARVQAEPDNYYFAYAFFVGADYLLYRAYPGYANKEKRERLLESHPFLHACSRIANGAAGALALEGGAEEADGEPARREYTDPNCREEGCPYQVLYVQLEGGEKQARSSVGAAELARRVLDFWETHYRP